MKIFYSMWYDNNLVEALMKKSSFLLYVAFNRLRFFIYISSHFLKPKQQQQEIVFLLVKKTQQRRKKAVSSSYSNTKRWRPKRGKKIRIEMLEAAVKEKQKRWMCTNNQNEVRRRWKRCEYKLTLIIMWNFHLLLLQHHHQIFKFFSYIFLFSLTHVDWFICRKKLLNCIYT